MPDLCILGYHANDSYRCQKFLIDESFMIECTTDTDFLGTGMYFWSTETDARWWKKEKNKEMIIKAVLSINNLLDLTDQEIAKSVQSAVDKIDKVKWYSKENRKKSLGNNASKAPGVCLDAIFESFPTYFKKFDIIKGRQSTSRKEVDFFVNTRLTTTDVDLYCVKNLNPILEREEVIA